MCMVKVHSTEEKEASNSPRAPRYLQIGGHIIKMIFSGLHSSVRIPYAVAAPPLSNTLVGLTF